METIVLKRGQISRQDRMIGLGASLFLHLFFLAVTIYIPGSTSTRAINLPVYSVDLVSAAEIKMPEKRVEAPKVQPRKPQQVAARPVQRISPEKSVSVAGAQQKLQKIEDAPKIDLARLPVAPIEETLERLIPEDVNPEINVEETMEKVVEPQAAKPAGQTRPNTGMTGPPSAGSLRQQDTGEIALARRLYYASVWDKIRGQWALPKTYLGSNDVEAVLILNVRRDGRIINVRFEKRSGSTLFDDSVLRAVRKADPLPPFPDIYSPSSEEIGVRFRPEDLG